MSEDWLRRRHANSFPSGGWEDGPCHVQPAHLPGHTPAHTPGWSRVAELPVRAKWELPVLRDASNEQ